MSLIRSVRRIGLEDGGEGNRVSDTERKGVSWCGEHKREEEEDDIKIL